jgi:AcrR family transcriptional regulator
MLPVPGHGAPLEHKWTRCPRLATRRAVWLPKDVVPGRAPARRSRPFCCGGGAGQGALPARPARVGVSVVGEPISRASLRSSAQRAPTTLLSEGQAGSGPRQRLLEAMVGVVARRGYHESTVRDVIAHAGCSRSTFYAQFADMEDCLITVLLVLADELSGQVHSAVQDAPAAEAPKAAARALLDFAHEHEAPARVLFCESLAGGARAMDSRDALIEEIAALVEGRLRSQAKDAATFDVPAGAAIGTVFRLLANRMRRGASGRHELQEAVLAWLDAYATNDPHGHSKRVQTLGEQGELPRIRLTPATPPPPMRLGSHGTGASDRSRNQRERILFACARCCYEQGYAQMTVADIVTSAAVSRTVFYEHFRDKQHVAPAMLEQGFEMGMTNAARAYFAQESWPEGIWACARALCETYATYPAQLHSCFVEYATMGPPAVQLMHDRLMAFSLLLEDGYHQRPQAEELPRTVSEVVVSLIFELAYREMRRRQRPDSFYELLPLLNYMCVAPFIGPAQASRFVQAKVEELKAEG